MKISQKITLKFAKRSKKLPIVLSREEIKNIIDSTRSPKHKLIISLAYDSGLRISEVVNLKIKDVNLEELTIHLKKLSILKTLKVKKTESLFSQRKFR